MQRRDYFNAYDVSKLVHMIIFFFPLPLIFFICRIEISLSNYCCKCITEIFSETFVEVGMSGNYDFNIGTGLGQDLITEEVLVSPQDNYAKIHVSSGR